MEINSDTLETQLPYYLTTQQKEGLTKELSDFLTKKVQKSFFLNKYPNEMLQGDGWSGLQVFNFETGNKKQIKGVILSNTCDISPENTRGLPVKIIFAPIIKLSSYIERLRSAQLDEEQISSKVQAIKNQNITNLFYIPQQEHLQSDYIAVLDDLHSIPSSVINIPDNQTKVFTLSMFGFYLFLLKLSIHFCRFHEEVAR